MASKKITELDPLTTSVDDDVVAVVDTSAQETKKQTKVNFLKEVQADIDDHIGDTDNPHSVTAAQLGVDWVFDAIPTGAVDGSNKSFTIPAASQVIPYPDGLRADKSVAYTTATVGNTTTITFNDNYQPFGFISVDYLPA